MNQDIRIRRMVLSAFLMALCMVLPLLTGQIPQIGSALSPMHIPVLLCGFVCGWPYGMVVGLLAPLVRGLIFGMPPLMPTGVTMAFELAAYGAATGVLYRLLPRKPVYVYITLIAAMLLGRVIWGCAQVVVLGLSGSAFTWSAFWLGAFVKSVPGIVLHILLIPPIVLILTKARFIR